MKFVELRSNTNVLIKEFAKENLDAALEWVHIQKKDCKRRNLYPRSNDRQFLFIDRKQNDPIS